MITTKKRISIALNKEDVYKLDRLCRYKETTPSDILKKALYELYDEWQKELEKNMVKFD